MRLELLSPCKINLLLNILGPRPDGFHELETVLLPVPVWDRLSFERLAAGVRFTCDDPTLPADGTNLVECAARAFFERAGVVGGVRIHLEKRVPVQAGLGGGSANAAYTLRGLNRLFDAPLGAEPLRELAARLGADVAFFLHDGPALATGRGEVLTPLAPFPVLASLWVLLIHPGFGIPTPWAYRALGRFPDARQGVPGRAAGLVEALRRGDLTEAAHRMTNALEAPAFFKYPWLALARDFLAGHGAVAARMTGSGSALFALVPSREAGEQIREAFLHRFGTRVWTALVPLAAPAGG